MIRMVGAGLVVLSAGAVGFGYARGVRLQYTQLEGLVWCMDYMKSEISTRLTPLPVLFSMLGGCQQKDVGAFFEEAGRALSQPPGCTIPVAFKRALQKYSAFAPGEDAVQALYGLAMGLGRFELESQLAAIEACLRTLDTLRLSLQAQKKTRCKSYETIGICAGLALAVILL